MIVDIFIRTYSNDIKWLEKSILSIEKNLTGWRHIVIVAPDSKGYKTAYKKFNGIMGGKVFVYKCPSYRNDYIGQQITKLQAFNWTSADYVFFNDSDTFIIKPTNVLDLIIDGKPEILYTDWSMVGDAICWKEPTEKALEASVPYEFMRSHPFIYKVEHLKVAYQFLTSRKGMDAEKWLKKQNHFSEFNFLGAFLYLSARDYYRFTDTNEEPFDRSFIKQFWSHTPMNNEVIIEINEYI